MIIFYPLDNNILNFFKEKTNNRNDKFYIHHASCPTITTFGSGVVNDDPQNMTLITVIPAIVVLSLAILVIVYFWRKRKNHRSRQPTNNVEMMPTNIEHNEDYYYDDPEDDYKVYTDDTHNTYYQFDNAAEKRAYLKEQQQKIQN